MLKNYFKTAFRNLLKNKAFTFIHVIGLSVGITSILLILFYVQYERSYEAMREKADNIFRISFDLYNGNEFTENDTETYQT
jgi:putative ABC transport system permease protein